MGLDFDADDVFAYKVPRRVIIRDRWLGIARILILIGLFVYVVIYEVIIQRGYLQKDEPFGLATMSIRKAGDGSAAHCCSGASCPTDRIKLECVSWDRHNILYPPTEEYSILITTRVSVSTSQELPPTCRLNSSSSPCPPWETNTITPYYTKGVEEMTIRVDHNVYGRSTNKIIRSQEMDKGTMVDWDDETLYTFCGGLGNGFAVPVSAVSSTECTEADRNRIGDVFTVRQILTLAGVSSLDSFVADIEPKGENTPATASSDSIRYDGIVILVLIGYDGHGMDTELTYKYRAFPLKGLDFKTEQVYYNELPNGNIQRVVWNRHGVRVIISSAGFVASFSFVELMKTLMVASGLLSVAKFIVEVILIRMLPFSSVYKRYRDVKTVDFSDYSKEQLKQLTDDDFSMGVVRRDADVTGAINPDSETEIGDKLDSKVNEVKAQHPLPGAHHSPHPLATSGSSASSPASFPHNGGMYEQPLLPKAHDHAGAGQYPPSPPAGGPGAAPRVSHPDHNAFGPPPPVPQHQGQPGGPHANQYQGRKQPSFNSPMVSMGKI